jgi:hypothetical protein
MARGAFCVKNRSDIFIECHSRVVRSTRLALSLGYEKGRERYGDDQANSGATSHIFTPAENQPRRNEEEKDGRWKINVSTSIIDPLLLRFFVVDLLCPGRRKRRRLVEICRSRMRIG